MLLNSVILTCSFENVNYQRVICKTIHSCLESSKQVLTDFCNTEISDFALLKIFFQWWLFFGSVQSKSLSNLMKSDQNDISKVTVEVSNRANASIEISYKLANNKYMYIVMATTEEL